jgi:hypothetical protein
MALQGIVQGTVQYSRSISQDEEDDRLITVLSTIQL